MTFLQGDIVLIPFPFSDQSGSKPRPAIIISNRNVNKTRDVILAQISSLLRYDDFSFVLEDKLLTTPLREVCEVRCHKIFIAEKSLVTKKISSLKAGVYDNLFDKIQENIQPYPIAL